MFNYLFGDHLSPFGVNAEFGGGGGLIEWSKIWHRL